jgi:hypothetical protein
MQRNYLLTRGTRPLVTAELDIKAFDVQTASRVFTHIVEVIPVSRVVYLHDRFIA